MAELAFMVAGSLLEKLGSVAKDEISLAWGMKKELRKLKDKTLMLRSVLKDAEKKQASDEQLRAWLVQVKDVFNDAVDVLDEVDCEALRRQVVKEYGSVGIKVRRFFSCDNPVAFRFSVSRKVKEIRERLDEIVGNMGQFQLIRSQLVDHHEGQSHMIDREWRDRMTDSFVNASEVIGRDKDREEIIQMLLSQEDPNSVDNLSVIPIVGFGGLGKTTLAKSVYNDDKIGTSFELKLWVCVSLDFDVTRLVREILRETKAVEEDISNMSREQLQTSLRSILQGKKFLLVLDDVWNEDRHKWLELRARLAMGAEGSTVIVTTRTTLVSEIMTRTPPHQLKGLSDADSLTLFFKCAFEDEKLAGRCPGLEGIGKEIVRKCGGVPLALKTLGSLLYSKTDEAEWIRIRDSEIWELERGKGRILPALRLSYNAMSPCLKQCFSYCSTYPEDAKMNSTELIYIWMALGILQSPNEETELEDIGQFKFKELCARAFFQCDDDDGDDDTVYGLAYRCRMHDLIHDLAHSITESECCIVKSGRENIPEGVRHLRIDLKRNAPIVLKKFKKLQSFYIDGPTEECNINEFISTFIAQLRYLRIFDISGSSFEVLPRSIGTLKHLRFLDLSNNKIKRLPNSICMLQNLQFLGLRRCEELEELPRDLRKLVSLRVLTVTTKQEYFPENGIGCLKSLRILLIEECKNLLSLPHDMRNCTTLRTLLIKICGQLDLATKPNDAINKLSLQRLLILGLPRMTALPQWLKGASHGLKLLVIEDCNKLGALPEWLPNFVSLQKLVIKRCEELSGLPNGIESLTSLTHLEIVDCENLHLESGDGGSVQLKLQTLIIHNLPQATAYPNWLQGASDSLRRLEIRGCQNLVALPEWLPSFVSLQKLVIKECEELSSLPNGMEGLTSLTHLEIVECKHLHLESGHDGSIQLKLQTLMIVNLPQATTFPNWLRGASDSLRRLEIGACGNLVALPEWLPNFVSLETLELWSCPKLLALPEGMQQLTSLTDLTIGDCENLELASESNEVVQLCLQRFYVGGLLETRKLPEWLQGAAHTLQHLHIEECGKLDALPEWLPNLTSLKRISISTCPKLSSLPEGMSRLTSLTDFEIRNPSAALRANTAHIPNIRISHDFRAIESDKISDSTDEVGVGIHGCEVTDEFDEDINED